MRHTGVLPGLLENHRMETIIGQIIDRAINQKNYFHVLGMAIEMQLIGTLESAIIASTQNYSHIASIVSAARMITWNSEMKFSSHYNSKVIQKVLSLYSSQGNHNLAHVAKYLFMLDDREKLTTLLKRLIYSDSSSPVFQKYKFKADLPVALQICFDLYDNCQQKFLGDIIMDLQTEASMKTAELIEMGVIDISNVTEAGDATLSTSGLDYKTLPYLSNLHKLVSILDGTIPNRLQLDFMVRSLKYDSQIIVNMQQNAKYPTSHTATSVCNALVHIGTTCDTLIRTNVDWLISHFTPYLQPPVNNIVQHGACLGVGLAAMGSLSKDLYTMLLSILEVGDAVSGEAAAIGIGLVMLGSANIDAYSYLKNLMVTSKHEKIQRGIALALSMRPISRVAAVYVITMAYAGTNDSFAVKTLWRIAGSDANDDVKRASLIALGLVMFREPQQFLGIALLFVQTYNPFLRCGALLAIGINIVNLVKSLFIDTSLIVRQAAFIACAMIIIQSNEKTTPSYNDIRSTISNICTDRHSDTVAKFGAYVAYGILDAGGHNQSMTFQTLEGHTRIQSVVGLLIFTQFWYWFPLVHLISLCFVPSSIILVNQNLDMPSITFSCDADLSLFSCPIPQETPKNIVLEKIRPVQLSHSLKSSRSKRRGIHPKDSDMMHTSRMYCIKKPRNSHIFNRTTIKFIILELLKNSNIKLNEADEDAFIAKLVETQPTNEETNTSATSNQKIASIETEKNAEIIKMEEIGVPVESSLPSSCETISDSSTNLCNPVRALPQQLKHMLIDESCLPLETVKLVSSGGIIVCYTENEQDDAKLKTISKSNKKPTVEDVPNLKPTKPRNSMETNL
ncbi:hypothetical protein MXB_5100 [Myxobolus squamalis]|nr:hypothetical protein MXB_5100 [Myxobolus squamalis]